MGGICSPESTRNSEMKTEFIGNHKYEDKQHNVRANKNVPITNEEISELEVVEERKLIIKEFDENILNYGKYITEVEKEEKVHENVKKIEALINKFDPTNEELKNFMNLFSREPFLFNDGTIYHGSWNYNGKKEGVGEFIKVDGSKYTGIWNMDQIEGRGRYIDKNGNFYEGEWKNGMADGHGILMITQGSRYEGGWSNDLQEGYGEESFSDKTAYRGQYHNGHKDGKGVFTWSDGSYYEGDFLNSNITGQGILRWKDDRHYEGEWLNNKMHGKGTFTWPDGKKYIGEYKHDKKEGFGTYYWDSNKYYEGEWFNSRQHGEGKLFLNGKVLRGQFRFGKIIKKYDDNGIKDNNKVIVQEFSKLQEENPIQDKLYSSEKTGGQI